jgi:hypothetical protein
MSVVDEHGRLHAAVAIRSSLEGLRVHSADGKDAGRIERVDEHGLEVATGRWLLAHLVSLPLDSIKEVDFEHGTVVVARALNEIASAPQPRREGAVLPYAGVWWPYAGSWWPWMRR